MYLVVLGMQGDEVADKRVVPFRRAATDKRPRVGTDEARKYKVRAPVITAGVGLVDLQHSSFKKIISGK